MPKVGVQDITRVQSEINRYSLATFNLKKRVVKNKDGNHVRMDGGRKRGRQRRAALKDLCSLYDTEVDVLG
jgi:hypothetical protein